MVLGTSGSITLEWTSLGAYPEEKYWEIVETGDSQSGVFEGTQQISDLSPGVYTISTIDTYGDGWDGSVLTITDVSSDTSYAITNEDLDNLSGSPEVNLLSFEVTASMLSTCDYASCYGCIYPSAPNYNELWDG